jgi:serine/threonine protein phosphatase PrpC
MFRVSEHAKRTDVGRQRPANEDSVFVRAPLFVVADGMGGAQAGEVASKAAVDTFAGGLPDGEGSPEERLAGLVTRANAQIHALAQSDEQWAGMGTTLTAAYLDDEDLAVAHVGDSRLYLLRDGALQQLTDDHSLVGELVRRGQLTPEEAEEHPQRSIITRALGPEGEVAVDHHTWPVRDGDLYLLCSDGLTGMVSDAAVTEILTGAENLTVAAQRLIDAANAAGGRDNITVVLLAVEEVGDVVAVAQDATAEHAVVDLPPAAEATAVGAVATSSKPLTTVLRTPRMPPPSAAPVRRRRRWAGPMRVFTLLLVLAIITASGLWIAAQSVTFVGTNPQGFVTLYKGLPFETPVLDLYQTEFVTGLPAETLDARSRKVVTDHTLRSPNDGADLVRQLEMGRLAGQR